MNAIFNIEARIPKATKDVNMTVSLHYECGEIVHKLLMVIFMPKRKQPELKIGDPQNSIIGMSDSGCINSRDICNIMRFKIQVN